MREEGFMQDTDRILARNVGRTLSPEEMEAVNGTGTTYYSRPTGISPPYDTTYGLDYEWDF